VNRDWLSQPLKVAVVADILIMSGDFIPYYLEETVAERILNTENIHVLDCDLKK